MEKQRAKLSVIIVAMNEAHDMGDCLLSVKGLADEIIVFDSGSTDGTQAICKQHGALVFETDWPGDGIQKNRALNAAQYEWILCLDADERISDTLRSEIDSLLSNGSDDVLFSTPRHSSFCGRFMNHSGWWPDRIDRVFKRQACSFSNDAVHPRLIINGTKGQFQGHIIHYSISNISESIEKINAYSSSGATILFEKGKRSSLSKAIGKGLWAFIRTYLLRLGFLDGKHGFILAIANAEGTYYRYLKLAFMQNNQKKISKKI